MDLNLCRNLLWRERIFSSKSNLAVGMQGEMAEIQHACTNMLYELVITFSSREDLNVDSGIPYGVCHITVVYNWVTNATNLQG